jgi:4-diphosphocytidyl-2-C-methyl-D-erythritol kinase
VQELLVKAPAKVNLVLRVLDRRPDGYHNLWSLIQTVGLEDELRLKLRPDSPEVRLYCDDPTLPTDGRNLVHRAAVRVLEHVGRRVGVDIQVTKRIPIAAGLGGGSSDAAATIWGLAQALGVDWPMKEMVGLGQVLGSDVPFFFSAPTAFVRGRGEEVSPVTLTGKRWIVLVNPGFPIETRWAYECLSQSRQGVRPLSDALCAVASRAVLAWEDVLPLMENDFEPALNRAYPALGEIKRALLAEGAEVALLSGSGSTVFGIFRDEGPALRAQTSLGRTAGFRAYAVRTCTGPSFYQNDPASKPLQAG